MIKTKDYIYFDFQKKRHIYNEDKKIFYKLKSKIDKPIGQYYSEEIFKK